MWVSQTSHFLAQLHNQSFELDAKPHVWHLTSAKSFLLMRVTELESDTPAAQLGQKTVPVPGHTLGVEAETRQETPVAAVYQGRMHPGQIYAAGLLTATVLLNNGGMDRHQNRMNRLKILLLRLLQQELGRWKKA